MRKNPVTGANGLKGWSADFVDHDDYRSAVLAEIEFLRTAWGNYPPTVTSKRIAYQPPGGGPLRIVTPSQPFMMMLRRGGFVRHMRVVDEYGPMRAPVFEGTGELLPSMTEAEALEFLIWKDVPRGTNHIAIIDADDIPADRSRRQAWSLAETGIAA